MQYSIIDNIIQPLIVVTILAVYIENTHMYLKDKCKALYSVSYNDTKEMVENETLKATFPILADVGTFFVANLSRDI